MILESGLQSIQRTVWRSEEDTRAFAELLACHAELADASIELQGDLGAGKTTFARHLLRALGVAGRIKSPTYAIVEPYEVARPQRISQKNAQTLCIWHFDFYRFNDPREWEDAGFREIFASPGLKLVEWPEKARALLPRADLVIELALRNDDGARDVTLAARSETALKLLK